MISNEDVVVDIDKINKEFGKVICAKRFDDSIYVGIGEIPEFIPMKYKEVKENYKKVHVFPYWKNVKKFNTHEECKNDLKNRINSFLDKFNNKSKMSIFWRVNPVVEMEMDFSTKDKFYSGFVRFMIVEGVK